MIIRDLISFLAKLKKEEYMPWKKTLIIELLGKKIGFGFFKKKLDAIWARQGMVQLIDLGNDYFLAKFSADEDYEFVLTGGPWMVFDHYLTVKQWYVGFNPQLEGIHHIAAWVRLPDTLMECYNERFLNLIGNRIGKTVRIDHTTNVQARGKFARLCVEVDLDKPLLANYRWEGQPLKIEYEGMHLICFHCGRYGHQKDACIYMIRPMPKPHETTKADNSKDSEKQQGQPMPESNEDRYGPWLVVTKPRRTRKGNPDGAKKQNHDEPTCAQPTSNTQDQPQTPPSQPSKNQDDALASQDMTSMETGSLVVEETPRSMDIDNSTQTLDSLSHLSETIGNWNECKDPYPPDPSL